MISKMAAMISTEYWNNVSQLCFQIQRQMKCLVIYEVNDVASTCVKMINTYILHNIQDLEKSKSGLSRHKYTVALTRDLVVQRNIIQ